MTKPNQIDAPVYGFHPVHGELIAAKDARKAIEHVLNQHKPNTELVGEVTQYCMENNIGLGEISTKALMEECDRLRRHLAEAEQSQSSLLGYVYRIREACGDNGVRMQDELLDHVAELKKAADRCKFLHVSPLEKEAVPSLFVASDMSFCTHRMADTDIAVWCDGAKQTLRLMECLEKLTERCRLLEEETIKNAS